MPLAYQLNELYDYIIFIDVKKSMVVFSFFFLFTSPTCLFLVFSLASAVIQSSVEDLLISTAIHEVCTSSEDCPAHSTCRPSGCDGYNCLCDKEYVASSDRTICMKGMFYLTLKIQTRK